MQVDIGVGLMNWPGLELYRIESAPRKYFRFHLQLYIREEAKKLNAEWLGLELSFHYYPCWLERLDWRMGYVYDPLNFEKEN